MSCTRGELRHIVVLRSIIEMSASIMLCTLVDCKAMELEGTLSRLQTFGSWGKGILTTGTGATVQVIGEPLAVLKERGTYAMSGAMSSHPQFGQQFRVDAVRAVVDRKALSSLLQETYAGCGEKTARLILAHFEEAQGGLEELIRTVNRRPWELEHAEELCGKKLKYIGTERHSAHERVLRTITDRLPEQGLNPYAVEALITWLEKKIGDEQDGREQRALETLLADPYAPIGKQDTYGFVDAEVVGAALGFPWNHPSRLGWIALTAVQRVSAKGHTYSTIPQFSRAIKSLESRAQPKLCLEEGIKRGLPLVLDKDRIYLKQHFEAEKTVADAFAGMLSRGRPLWAGTFDELQERIAHMERDVGSFMDESQREALLGILTSPCRLHTLTAGPGCGKTTVMEMFAALVADVRFVTPIGIAAKVLGRRIEKYGQVAQTIHAALESTGESYRKDAENPLVANLVVVDEAGMQGLPICAALMRAFPLGAHLLLVGDVEQLDSVEVGRVLADVVEMPEPDHHRLTTSHRSTEGILKLLDAIKQGMVPDEPADESVSYVGFDEANDLSFEAVSRLWLECVERNGLENVLLLFGHRNSTTGNAGMNVNQANTALQNLVNPASNANRVYGTRIRLGDRVIVKKPIVLRRRLGNGGEEVYAQLVNGDVGYLKNVRRGAGGKLESAFLRMDDGRDIELPWGHFGKIDLSYAQTVHSAQGSECDEVIFVVHGEGNEFLNRKLLTTGISRAKRRVTIVGRRSEVESVAAHVAPRRQSWLQVRIQESKEYQ